MLKRKPLLFAMAAAGLVAGVELPIANSEDVFVP